jgi:hypothetical protein
MDKIKNEEHIYHQGQVFSHGKYISLTAAIIDLCKRKVVGGDFDDDDDDDKHSHYWQTL